MIRKSGQDWEGQRHDMKRSLIESQMHIFGGSYGPDGRLVGPDGSVWVPGFVTEDETNDRVLLEHWEKQVGGIESSEAFGVPTVELALPMPQSECKGEVTPPVIKQPARIEWWFVWWFTPSVRRDWQVARQHDLMDLAKRWRCCASKSARTALWFLGIYCAVATWLKFAWSYIAMALAITHCASK